MTRHNPTLNRFSSTRNARTLVGFAQPALAYLGMTGSLLVLLLFPSAIFWQKPATPLLVTQTFFVPVVVLVGWLVLKLLRYLNPSPNRKFAWHTVWPDGQQGLQDAFDGLVLLSGYSGISNTEVSRQHSSTEVEEVEVVEDNDLRAV